MLAIADIYNGQELGDKMNFRLDEYAHDTPGKIVSYQLVISGNGMHYKVELDIPEAIELSLLLQNELEEDKDRFSDRFNPKK